MTIIDELLLAEFRAMPCEFCGKPGPSDPEHVYPRALGGSRRLDVRENLVALCRYHHNNAGSGHGEPSKAQLKAHVAKREKSTVEAIWEYLCVLWRLPKGADVPNLRRIDSDLDATRNEVSF